MFPLTAMAQLLKDVGLCFFYDNSSLESYQHAHVKEYKAILLSLSMPLLFIGSMVLNIRGKNAMLEKKKV